MSWDQARLDQIESMTEKQKRNLKTYTADEFESLSYNDKQKIATRLGVHGTLPPEKMNPALWDLVGDPEDDPPEVKGLAELEPRTVTHGELNCMSPQDLQSLAAEYEIERCNHKKIETLLTELREVATPNPPPRTSTEGENDNGSTETNAEADPSPKKFYYVAEIDNLSPAKKQREAEARGFDQPYQTSMDILTKKLKRDVATEIEDRRRELSERDDTEYRCEPCDHCQSHYFTETAYRPVCADCGTPR